MKLGSDIKQAIESLALEKGVTVESMYESVESSLTYQIGPGNPCNSSIDLSALEYLTTLDSSLGESINQYT